MSGRRIAAYGVLGLLAMACGTAPGPNLLTSQPQWEWRAACCGFAGDQRTPATEGHTYVLQFSHSGRVSAVRDGELLLETGYRFTTSGGGLATDPAITVTYDQPLPLVPGVEAAPAHLVMLAADGTLLLRNLAPCADCYGDWTFLPSLVN